MPAEYHISCSIGRTPIQMTENYSEGELKAMSTDELVRIVIELEEKNKKLEDDLAGLRGEVALQAIEEEAEEENEINNFRRLSIECANQGIPVELPEQRVGASIDQCGSLTNCVTRQEPAIVSLSNYTNTSSTESTGKFVMGSMQASIEEMSNSLSVQNQLRTSSTSTQPVIIKSFTQLGKGLPSGTAPTPLAAGNIPSGKQQPAAPAQIQPMRVTGATVEYECTSDSDIVI